MSLHPTLFARQPIHDRDLRVCAYELLFRAPEAHSADVTDATSATADVVTRAMLDVGFDTLVHEHKAWVNAGRDFLVRRAFESLPPERVVLEVLETVRDEPEVLAALHEARAAGFSIALDDFVLRDDTATLVDLSDYIKLDCLGLTANQARERFLALSPSGRVLLAEKVESREMVEACASGGAELFQGYFLTRPECVKGANVRSDRLRLLQVIGELNSADTSIERVAELIQLDVSISYRVLRYANSASLGRARVFEHVRDAITMLGLDRVRAVATLMILSSLSVKPAELARIALIRARYCQLLGSMRGGDPQKHFVAGLFSVLDAFLDDSMDNVVAKLPLDAEITAALIERRGELGRALGATIACEQADWSGALLDDVPVDDLGAAYVSALAWADKMQSAVEVN